MADSICDLVDVELVVADSAVVDPSNQGVCGPDSDFTAVTEHVVVEHEESNRWFDHDLSDIFLSINKCRLSGICVSIVSLSVGVAFLVVGVLVYATSYAWGLPWLFGILSILGFYVVLCAILSLENTQRQTKSAKNLVLGSRATRCKVDVEPDKARFLGIRGCTAIIYYDDGRQEVLRLNAVARDSTEEIQRTDALILGEPFNKSEMRVILLKNCVLLSKANFLMKAPPVRITKRSTALLSGFIPGVNGSILGVYLLFAIAVNDLSYCSFLDPSVAAIMICVIVALNVAISALFMREHLAFLDSLRPENAVDCSVVLSKTAQKANPFFARFRVICVGDAQGREVELLSFQRRRILSQPVTAKAYRAKSGRVVRVDGPDFSLFEPRLRFLSTWVALAIGAITPSAAFYGMGLDSVGVERVERITANEAWEHHAKVRLALRSGDLERLQKDLVQYVAFQEMAHVVSDVPERAKVLRMHGVLLCEQGDDVGAVQKFEEAVSLAPNFEGPYYELARIEMRKGAIASAIALLNKAVVLNPTYLDALEELTRVQLVAGNKDDAKQCLARCVALKPLSVDLQIQRILLNCSI